MHYQAKPRKKSTGEKRVASAILPAFLLDADNGLSGKAIALASLMMDNVADWKLRRRTLIKIMETSPGGMDVTLRELINAGIIVEIVSSVRGLPNQYRVHRGPDIMRAYARQRQQQGHKINQKWLDFLDQHIEDVCLLKQCTPAEVQSYYVAPGNFGPIDQRPSVDGKLPEECADLHVRVPSIFLRLRGLDMRHKGMLLKFYGHRTFEFSVMADGAEMTGVTLPTFRLFMRALARFGMVCSRDEHEERLKYRINTDGKHILESWHRHKENGVDVTEDVQDLFTGLLVSDDTPRPEAFENMRKAAEVVLESLWSPNQGVYQEENQEEPSKVPLSGNAFENFQLIDTQDSHLESLPGESESESESEEDIIDPSYPVALTHAQHAAYNSIGTRDQLRSKLRKTRPTARPRLSDCPVKAAKVGNFYDRAVYEAHPMLPRFDQHEPFVPTLHDGPLVWKALSDEKLGDVYFESMSMDGRDVDDEVFRRVCDSAGGYLYFFGYPPTIPPKAATDDDIVSWFFTSHRGVKIRKLLGGDITEWSVRTMRFLYRKAWNGVLDIPLLTALQGVRDGLLRYNVVGEREQGKFWQGDVYMQDDQRLQPWKIRGTQDWIAYGQRLVQWAHAYGHLAPNYPGPKRPESIIRQVFCLDDGGHPKARGSRKFNNAKCPELNYLRR